MPELPEVTTIIGILKPLVVNETIVNVEILYERMFLSDVQTFKEQTKNETFLDITRKGKFIIFHLTNNKVIISHLRMEGKYSFLDECDANPKFTNVVFHLTNNKKLVYFDTRKFGIMKLSNELTYLNEKPLNNVGPEPMSVNDSNVKIIYKKLAKNKHIKELIMDQSIMAGIGNIYADEILYQVCINPLTPGNNLSLKDYDNIIQAAKEILTKAIEEGGSTIRSYHPKEGLDGRFQVLLKAYGHEGQRCERCGTIFHKIRLGGRGTTFCPNCQIDYSIKKAIGITGPIGAGKSEATKYAAELGYFTLNCDEIVHELYSTSEVKRALLKLFGNHILINDSINYSYLRDLISRNPSAQLSLENIVHPLVEQRLINEINNHDRIVIEVPLLFKAHLQYLFKKIIYVKADNEVLLKRLKERNYKDTQVAIDTYYKNNNFVNNNDVIIIDNTNLTLNEFKEEIKKYLD